MADDFAGVFALALGVEAILPLAAFKLLLAVHVAQIVNRVRDHGDVDAADLGRLERVLDRGWRLPSGGPDVAVELRAGERRHVRGR
jgi:hypothetical protein